MQIDKLDAAVAKIDPNIIACLGLMDDNEKSDVKRLMFELVPVLLKIDSEMDEQSTTKEILEGALAYATATVTVAAIAGL